MPNVPAHTNKEGAFVLSVTSVAQWRVEPSGGWITSSETVQTAKSTKSVTKDGLFHPVFPGFRCATSYSRNVLRFDDLSGGGDFTTKTSPFSTSRYGYKLADSRHLYGLLAAVPSGALGEGVFVSTNLINRCVTDALLKVQDMKVDLGTFLAEAVTTANMIAQRAVQLLKVALALSDGRFGYAASLLFGSRSSSIYFRNSSGKGAADLWLEWQYGWRPLISDILGGIELIQTGFRERKLLFHVERTITQPLDPRSYFQVTNPMSDILTTGQSWESARVSLWGSVDSTALANLGSLGLLNPLSLAWELTTLSFVFDWLFSVGDFLQSLGATVGINFVDGSLTRRVYTDVVGTRTYASLGASGKVPSARLRQSLMQRTVYNGWPWGAPAFRNPFSTSHVTSAIALLAQRR